MGNNRSVLRFEKYIVKSISFEINELCMDLDKEIELKFDFDTETSITIGDLQENGYIEDSELINPKGDNFSKNSSVKITYNGTKITYTYERDKESNEKECGD